MNIEKLRQDIEDFMKSAGWEEEEKEENANIYKNDDYRIKIYYLEDEFFLNYRINDKDGKNIYGSSYIIQETTFDRLKNVLFEQTNIKNDIRKNKIKTVLNE